MSTRTGQTSRARRQVRPSRLFTPGPARGPRGPIPLVIGVTGHRDVRDADRAALEAAVKAILGELTHLYPSTGLVLVSPLAEGADRLAARAALDLGLPLIVPLPMCVADYERTFRDDGSIAEFRALLARASRSFVIEGPRGAPGPGGGARLMPGWGPSSAGTATR
jgi:hypothetical protein